MALDSRNPYLERLATRLGVRSDDLVAPMREWTCATCGVVYLDPYLSSEEERVMYQISPIHRLGWRQALAVVNGRAAAQWQERVRDVCEGVLGEIRSVREIGCPMFATSMAQPSVQVSARVVRMALPQLLSHRAPRHTDQVRALEWLAAAVGGLVRQLVRRRSRQPVWGPATAVTAQRQRCHESWGEGCIQLGRSCDDFAATLRARRACAKAPAMNGGIDLVTFVNVLDHVESPLRELMAAMPFRGALIIGHSPAGAAAQHRFALTHRSLGYLAARIGYRVVVVSEALGVPAGDFAALLVSPATTTVSRTHR